MVLRMRYTESVTGRYVSRARKMAGGPNFDSSLRGHEARPNSLLLWVAARTGAEVAADLRRELPSPVAVRVEPSQSQTVLSNGAGVCWRCS